jgi:dihydroorotate dehydrogenase
VAYDLIRPILFALPPEASHRCALESLRLAHKARWPFPGEPMQFGQAVECLSLRFKNPIGLAAGFDKNGDFIDALGALGFGFIEIGTLTPRPQLGNARPRVFRLPNELALVNQMGSPNKGIAHALEKMRRRSYRGILGVNVGKNADTPLTEAVKDYVNGYRAVSDDADYVALNMSSPNTEGLRELQGHTYLREILAAMVEEREKCATRTPVLIKLSPDFAPDALEAIGATVAVAGIDGIIATNSTVSRDGVALRDPRASRGGLSGQPLHRKSIATIRQLRAQLGEKIGIIGVGGITTADAALQTLAAGANLVQIYTGLVYRGPHFVADLVRAL